MTADVGELAGWVWKPLIYPLTWIRARVDEHEHKRLLQKHFGVSDYVLLRPGAAHRAYPGQVHPDNRDAARGIVSLFRSDALETRTGLVYDGGAGHRLVFGSPASTEEVGGLMGVLIDGRVRSDDQEPPISFKYVFGRRSRTKAKRFVGGTEIERRLWPLFDAQTKKAAYVPNLDASGWVKTDALLVTRLPNLHSTDTFEGGSGSYYVNIAGVTGIGTKAAAMLLADRRLLTWLDRQVGEAKCFQALVEITEIEHDKHEQESKPVRLQVLDACGIPIEQDRIRTWLSRVP